MWEVCDSTEVCDTPPPHLGQGESCKTDCHLNEQILKRREAWAGEGSGLPGSNATILPERA